MSATPYIGRFAPSPTGPLHAGSLVAALASWLDARAHGGRWLVRIEDVDSPRSLEGLGRMILQQLADCGLLPDEPPWYQSDRLADYQQALDCLIGAGLAYPCACSRKEIEAALQVQGQSRARNSELIYPGTCRNGLHGRPARAWRLRVDQGVQHWTDRRLGPQAQDVAQAVGDFILKRADGQFAYQLAVVVDDAAQGITHIVRGEDLADNTARQLLLQRALGQPTPRYLHTPLVFNALGEKLSKQSGAPALQTQAPLSALNAAAAVLGLHIQASSTSDWLAKACAQWTAKWADTHAQPAKI
ncbi:MAG: tRNA glutamyl-Q(34) synthetase GluQRS [Hylemonella sp.]